ncbi:MAG: trigger factor [Gammaproteobacteria bacterium]|nr:trigger factor [Gammaproteobacteria bacterium]
MNRTEGLEHKVSVQIPETRVSDEVQTRLNKLSRTARVDGFRPGKVPLRVIRQRFGSAIRQEVVGDLLRESFGKAMAEKQLRPAGDPVIDPLNATIGHGISYTATFDVYPDITLEPLEQLQLEKLVCDVTDDDITKMIDILRRQRLEWHDVERPAGPQDRLFISFRGTMNGEPFEGGSADNFLVDLNQRRLIQGFEDGLIGVAPGESRQLQLTFPRDYGKPEFAGNDVVFDVTVHKVQEMVLPDIDATFYASFGVPDADDARFREEVAANMARERDRRLEQRFKQEVHAKLLQANPIALPRGLVEQEAGRLLQQTKDHLRAQGATAAQVDTMTRDMVLEQARRRVHLGLLLAEVIKLAGLKADPALVRKRIEDIASGYEESEQVIAWYYQNPERRMEIEAQCLEDETIKWIATRAGIAETPVRFDALMNNGQTDDGHKANG